MLVNIASPSDRAPSSRVASSRVGRLVAAFVLGSTGNVAMVAALSAVPVAMGIGFAFDYTRATNARIELQDAVDAAVLAGARDGTAGWTAVASTAFDAMVSSDVTVSSKNFVLDADGNYKGTVDGSLSTSFTGLFSLNSLSVRVSATAVKQAAGNKVCLLLLSTSATPGLLLNSGANLTASNCEAHVKSTGTPAATFNSGTTFTTQKTCVAGANVLDNGGTHASLTKSCATTSDPYAGTLPVPSSSTCTYSNVNVNGGTVTAYPGVYCGWHNLNSAPTINFQPGVYVFKGGGVNANGGTWNGTGVTFYFADTSYFQFNGTVKLNLKAPTTGTYANLLWYEATGLAKTSFSMNATNGATLEGLIYLPSRNLTLNAGASVTSNKLSMVLNTLTMNTVNWTLSPADKSPSTSSTTSSSIYLKQ